MAGLRAVMAWMVLAIGATAWGADDALIGLLGQLDAADPAARKLAITGLADSGDVRLIGVLEDFSTGNLYRWHGQVVIGTGLHGDAAGIKRLVLCEPLTRTPLRHDGNDLGTPLTELIEMPASRAERSLVRDSLIVLRLHDPDREHRLNAVLKAGEAGTPSALHALEGLAQGEADAHMRRAIDESIALLRLSMPDPDNAQLAARIAAAQRLGELRSSRALPRLQELAASTTSADLAFAAQKAIGRIEQWQGIAHTISYLFSGLSLGSVLVLMALGLSIIFGLMGVINMAHGEMMMIGAYATYLTQWTFVHFMPAACHDWYFPVAIPVSFAIAAAAGVLIEWAIIRHLYGRPLETLLATWGVSLALIQTVRVIFGDNIAVNSPAWLQGGLSVATDITLPYARLFIIAFTFACVGGLTLVINRTRLGLLLRATTQNRTMAATLGVRTRSIDALTFALGSGLAGMAGCALTLIGGVTPDMGQNYIVDSFLVVVTGGVGKLSGAIIAGMGLGILNKLAEPVVQAVWAKVFILIIVILFLQWRPSGLFPAKGRFADV
jgi:urea transport system permease protein